MAKDKTYLQHHNPNHDPKNGQFTTALVGTAKGVEEVAKGVGELPKYKNAKGKVVKRKYPDMSDEELQKAVNRLSLEQRMSDLSGDTEYVKSGEEKAREKLQTIGAIAGIAASIAAIIGPMMERRMKNSGK